MSKYEPFKIPDRRQVQDDGVMEPLPDPKTAEPGSRLHKREGREASGQLLDEGLFYEIEYDSSPMPGVGKFVLKPQKIEEPEKDGIRDLFTQMRDIARACSSTYDYSKFFDRRVHHNNATIFYKQGMFMKDFTDNYSGNAQFSGYFPYYQMMGYEQLRTYFTWRTEARKGNVTDTSLSYAFLYIYELLGNIGVNDPQDGLDKLMSFWKAFSVHNKSIDKYVLRWLKDYHIYYELPQSFKEFVHKNNLTMHYPRIMDTDDNFDLFCAISKYDIKKSTFFTDDKAKLIKDCFYFVTDKLRRVFADNGLHFDESIFQPTKKMSVWTPFKDALFYQWVKQPDRRIVLSENEIYICSQNNWAFNTVITTGDGRQLIGYIMKQMEVDLRKATKYSFKLSAHISTGAHAVVGKLTEVGLSLENIIAEAVMEFYREATKTVVKVDHEVLSIIRQEALTTQEKLIVPEQDEQQDKQTAPVPIPLNLSMIAPRDIAEIPPIDHEPASLPDVWESFKVTLTETEMKALSVVLHGEANIKEFADNCGVMLEVLIDGINEKAMDFIGDNLMDEEFVIYDDYRDQVKELIV